MLPISSPSSGGKGSERRIEKTAAVRDNWPLRGCSNPLGNKEEKEIPRLRRTLDDAKSSKKKRLKSQKCDCSSAMHECCDICTGWTKDSKDKVI